MKTKTQFCHPSGAVDMSGWDGRGVISSADARLTGEIDSATGLPVAELTGNVICDEGDGAIFDAWWVGSERQYPQDGDRIDVLLRHDFVWGGEAEAAPNGPMIAGPDQLPALLDWMWDDLLPRRQTQADSIGVGDAWRDMISQRSTVIADRLSWGDTYLSPVAWAARKAVDAMGQFRSVGDRVAAILEIAKSDDIANVTSSDKRK